MDLNLTLTGDREAIERLNRIASAIGDDAMREFGLEALEPVAKASRSLVPVLTGETQGGITISPTLPDGGHMEYGGRAVFVGVLDGDSYWSAFLEFGTVKMRAKPFLLPAVDAKTDEVFEIIGDRAGKAILRAI